MAVYVAADDPRVCKPCRRAGQRFLGLPKGVGLTWRSGWGNKGWWPAGAAGRPESNVKPDEKCKGIGTNGREVRTSESHESEVLLYGALAAIACALKAYGWGPDEPPAAGNWPGGLPHCGTAIGGGGGVGVLGMGWQCKQLLHSSAADPRDVILKVTSTSPLRAFDMKHLARMKNHMSVPQSCPPHHHHLSASSVAVPCHSCRGGIHIHEPDERVAQCRRCSWWQ